MEKISVHEYSTLEKKLFSTFLAVIYALIVLFILFAGGPMGESLKNFLGGDTLLLLVFVFGPPTIIVYWGWGWIGGKSKATPITLMQKNLILCKEGLVVKSSIISWIYPWARIKGFSANQNLKQIMLNFGAGLNAKRSVFDVSDNFSEVERVLSEYISSGASTPIQVKADENRRNLNQITDLAFDLSSEKPEQLENKDRFIGWQKKEYRGSEKKAIKFVIAAFAGWLLFLALNTYLPYYNLVSYVGNLFVFGALLVFTIVVGLYVLGVLASKKDPVPLAGLTLEETLKHFFETPLNRIASQGEDLWLQAYVCLLDQAKQKEGSFDEFVEHMKNWSIGINQKLAEKTPLNTFNNPTKIAWGIVTVYPVEKIGDVSVYETLIKLDLWQGIDNPGVSSQKYNGSANLILSIPMAKVGSRYYLASLPIKEQIT